MNRQEPVALLKQYSPTFALQLLIKHLIKQFSVIPLIKCKCFDTATPITTFIGSPCLQRGLSDQNKGKLEAEVSRRWWLLKWTASRKSDRESWRLFSIQLWVLRSRLFLLIWQWFGGGAWLLLPVEPSSSQNSSSSSRPARTGWHPLVWELPVASPRWCGSRCVAYSWRSFARTHKAGRPLGHAAWCGYACRRAVPSRYGWDDAATPARARSGHGDVNYHHTDEDAGGRHGHDQRQVNAYKKIRFMILKAYKWVRQWTMPSLVLVTACRLGGTKPLPEPKLAICRLDHRRQIEYQWNINQIIIAFFTENKVLKMKSLCSSLNIFIENCI